ncbi:UDP-N-acetylmuramoyl-L-alanyl-D-glutamate--2,6-diaminopimelate ligase [Yaniella flava]|uniref:UDP-N-acetylmuramyl-tripeptide synthetase n=1 Tax=Yaniella flava TaxID=287930 RepID=A0ABP5G7N1_9MICC
MVTRHHGKATTIMLRTQNTFHTKLKAILKYLASHHPTSTGDTETTVAGISLNSKTVGPGELYAALAGAQHHGADYINQALDAGAVAVLTDASGATRVPEHVPAIVVDNVRGALADAAALIYGNVESQTPRVYGVTGTNGKTTTTYFLNALLAELGQTTGLIGTIETRIAGVSVPSQFTTPEAPDLHRLIARMREAGVESAAMEVSSHAMAYKRTFGLRYAVAGFTNLTQDHLDLHGSMDEYFAAKALLFAQGHSVGHVITLNGGAEPQWGQQLADQVDDAVTLDLGPAAPVAEPTQAKATWQVQDLEPAGLGHAFTLRHTSGFTATTTVDMPGKFNVANAALAAVMVFTGHDREHWERIRTALGAKNPGPFASAVPGRMEVIGSEPTVVVDFAHNPDGLTQALQAVNQSRVQHHGSRGRTIMVFGATGQRDTAKRPLMGRIAAEYADVVIVTDDDPHHEDPAEIRHPVFEAAVAHAQVLDDGTEVVEIAPRADALAYAVQIATPQDTILAAGRGHETHQDISGQSFEIDDRVVLREALEDHGFITNGPASPRASD